VVENQQAQNALREDTRSNKPSKQELPYMQSYFLKRQTQAHTRPWLANDAQETFRSNNTDATAGEHTSHRRRLNPQQVEINSSSNSGKDKESNPANFHRKSSTNTDL